MKILHILDQAGVACVLAKYQTFNGLDSKVLIYEGSDRFGIYKNYKDYVIPVKRKSFLKSSIHESKNVDIIHVHSLSDVMLKLRKYYQSKKIILHYHGTDIRGFKYTKYQYNKIKQSLLHMKVMKMNIQKKLSMFKYGYFSSIQNEAQKTADKVIVSTPDLLELTNGVYLPNPVDSKHFSKISNQHLTNNKALTFQTDKTDMNKTLKLLEKNNINLDLDVHDRTKDPIQYEDIPDFLRRYDIYVDIRYINDKVLQNLSKTALESLSCGLKVLNYKLEYVDKLPEVHNPIKVINQLQNIYNTL